MRYPGGFSRADKMKPRGIVLLVAISAVAGGAFGFAWASVRFSTSEAVPARAASLASGVEQLAADLARVESLLLRLEMLARSAPSSNDSGTRVLDAEPAGSGTSREPIAIISADEAMRRELHELRDQIARMAEPLANLRSPAANAKRMRECFAQARPADWDALTEYGKRWRDPELGAAARQEVLFLDQGELLTRFGRPNKVSMQSPSGMLWVYDRDRALLAIGDVYEVKFDLCFDGYVVNPWDVNVVESPERHK
jgi:hypothetical protein